MAAKLLEEVDDLTKLSLIPMSYSRLNTLWDKKYGCEAKYFYSYVLGEKDSSGPHALLGNVIHSVLENTYGERVDGDSLELGLQEYTSQLESWDPDGTLLNDEFRSIGKTLVEEFFERHLGELSNIVGLELSFELVVGRGLFRGYIDRVEREGNRITVTDFKTGKQMVPKKDVATNLQLGLYALVAKKMFPECEVYSQLYYLRPGTTRGHLFSDDDLLVVERELVAHVERLIGTSHFKFTANENQCKWCDYATTGTCPTGARRVRLKSY